MPTKTAARFDAADYTPTQFSTAEDKAKFARQFTRFASGGFKRTLFPKWFYRRLSNTFGHIAHYDINGFYAEFFTTPADRRRFLRQTAAYPCHGDPAFTFSDVERDIAAWVRDTDLTAAVNA